MQHEVEGKLAVDRQKAASVSETLRALAHPVRLRVVAILCEGDENVSGLARRLGLKQAIVSQQLRILRMSRLVATSPDRGFVRYTLAEPRLRELVRCFEGCRAGGEVAARDGRAARVARPARKGGVLG